MENTSTQANKGIRILRESEQKNKGVPLNTPFIYCPITGIDSSMVFIAINIFFEPGKKINP